MYFNRYFCLFVLSLFFGGLSSYAQSGNYDPTQLSAENQRKTQELETYLSEFTESDMLGMFAENKFLQLEFKTTKTENAALVHHPVPAIRNLFLQRFRRNCIKDQDTLRIYHYVMQYIRDTSVVDHHSGCVISPSDFSLECYRLFSRDLNKEQLQHIDRLALLSDAPLLLQEQLIEQLPENDSSYAILEQLVYQKKKITALRPLLSYRKPKDISAPLIFSKTTNWRVRESMFSAMAGFFDVSYENYLRSAIPELLSNNWNDSGYNWYFELLRHSSSATQNELRTTITASLKDDRVYECAYLVLYPLKDSLPESERDPFLLKLFPSIDFMDTAIVSHLRETYPAEFERKLEQRLLQVSDAYEDYQYTDSSYARFILQEYTATPSARKTEFYRKLIAFSSGPVLIEAVLQLKETHAAEVAIVLEKRQLEMVELQSRERPGLPYGDTHGLTLEEALWMESIQKAIVYLHDEELNKRAAKVIAGYLGNAGTGAFDRYAHEIVRSVNDPALYEQLLQKIESVPYDYPFNSVVELLLSLENPAYNARLKARYIQLKQTAEKENTSYFKRLLEDRNLVGR